MSFSNATRCPTGITWSTARNKAARVAAQTSRTRHGSRRMGESPRVIAPRPGSGYPTAVPPQRERRGRIAVSPGLLDLGVLSGRRRMRPEHESVRRPVEHASGLVVYAGLPYDVLLRPEDVAHHQDHQHRDRDRAGPHGQEVGAVADAFVLVA